MDNQLGLGRNIELEREHRIDQVLEMWKAGNYNRPEQMSIEWPNGDVAALKSGSGGFTITVQILTDEADNG